MFADFKANHALMPTPPVVVLADEPIKGATPVNIDDLSAAKTPSQCGWGAHHVYNFNENQGYVEQREGKNLFLTNFSRSDATLLNY